MKKIFLFLILFLFPLVVCAKDTCNSNDIKIQSIELENSIGNIEELSNPSISNQKINLGLKMNVLGDAAEYKVVVKNNSDEDYYFDEEALNLDMDSVNYEIIFDDNTNLIKGGEEKVVYLRVSYKDKIDASTLDNGLYNGTQVVKLNVMTLDNPFTGRFLGILVFISLFVGFFVFYKDKKETAYLLLLISLIIPFSVSAVCRHSLEVNANLVIDAREAIFLPGKEVNVKMKQLAGDDTSTVTDGFSFEDQLITAVEYSEIEPDNTNKEEKNIVSTLESGYPIYMWFDNGTIYWWSEDKTPALNVEARWMFDELNALKTIRGLKTFDSSNVVRMKAFFGNNISLLDVSPIANWNVEKVKDMSYLFAGCLSLEVVDLSSWKTPSLKSLTNMFGMWADNSYPDTNSNLKRIILSDKFDTSNVVEMYGFLANNTHIEDYSFLKYIDVSSATTLAQFFQNNLGLTNVEYIRNWDVSNVTTMQGMFQWCKGLTSVDLNNWNTSSLTNITGMFYNCNNISELNISNFDVSNIESLYYTFTFCSNVTHLDLSGWNTSNLKELSYAFSGMSSLEELDISNFDTRNVLYYQFMFSDSTSLKHIYVGENWDTSANVGRITSIFPSSSNLPNFSDTNPNYTDLSYAHTGEGGYLTLKTD